MPYIRPRRSSNSRIGRDVVRLAGVRCITVPGAGKTRPWDVVTTVSRAPAAVTVGAWYPAASSSCVASNVVFVLRDAVRMHMSRATSNRQGCRRPRRKYGRFLTVTACRSLTNALSAYRIADVQPAVGVPHPVPRRHAARPSLTSTRVGIDIVPVTSASPLRSPVPHRFVGTILRTIPALADAIPVALKSGPVNCSSAR